MPGLFFALILALVYWPDWNHPMDVVAVCHNGKLTTVLKVVCFKIGDKIFVGVQLYQLLSV